MVIHLLRESVCCATLSSMGAWHTKLAMEGTLNQLICGDYLIPPSLASLHSLIRLSARRHPLSILQDLPWQSSSEPQRSFQWHASWATYKTQTLSAPFQKSSQHTILISLLVIFQPYYSQQCLRLASTSLPLQACSRLHHISLYTH